MSSKVIGRGTRIFILVIAFTIGLMSVNIALMPNNNTAYAAVNENEYVFKYLAPKSQTTYKQVYKSTKAVKDIKKEGEDIKAVGNAISSFGLAISPKKATIGSVIQVAGEVVYRIGDYQVKSLQNLKDNTKSVVKLEFKWTDTSSYPLKGTFRITTYYSYKGTIKGKKTYTQKRQFALGERW